MTVCEKCGAENREGAEYCPPCGAKLPKPQSHPFQIVSKVLGYVFSILVIYLLVTQALKTDKSGRISGAKFFAFFGALTILLSYSAGFVDFFYDYQMNWRKKGRTVKDMRMEIRKSGYTGFGLAIMYLILAYFVHWQMGQ